MNVNEVEAARKRWIAERPVHEKFGVILQQRLNNAIRRIGIPVEVSSRAKEIDSFVKKLLVKTDHTYESMPDKVGVRVVHKFRSDSSRIFGVEAAVPFVNVTSSAPVTNARKNLKCMGSPWATSARLERL